MFLCQVRRPGRDHLVESATDPAAGDDSRGFKHPEPGQFLQHLYLYFFVFVFVYAGDDPRGFKHPKPGQFLQHQS